MRISLILLSCCAVSVAAAEDWELARSCAAIAAGDARLACYDKAFAPAPPARVNLPLNAAPVPPVASRPAPPAALPPPPAAARAPAAEPPPPVYLVTKASSQYDGTYRLTLENGEVWETRDADLAVSFKSGDRVTILKPLLGSWQITTLDRKVTAGARRVR
jgi:hypothetical protein